MQEAKAAITEPAAAATAEEDAGKEGGLTGLVAGALSAAGADELADKLTGEEKAAPVEEPPAAPAAEVSGLAAGQSLIAGWPRLGWQGFRDPRPTKQCQAAQSYSSLPLIAPAMPHVLQLSRCLCRFAKVAHSELGFVTLLVVVGVPCC